MVPKHVEEYTAKALSFRAVLFRMVPKPLTLFGIALTSFRAVLFRMVPKLKNM